MSTKEPLDQIESGILSQAGSLDMIKDYVDNQASKDQLHEVERNIFTMLLQYGRSLVQGVIESHKGGMIEGTVRNSNGDEVAYRGLRSREYLSIFGSIEVNRAYYWSPGSTGYFPLDSKLNLPENKYSYLLLQWTQSQIACQPYSEALENVQQILGLTLHKQGQERATQQIAHDVESFYKDVNEIDSDEEGEILIATADCKGVPMVPSQRSEPPKGS